MQEVIQEVCFLPAWLHVKEWRPFNILLPFSFLRSILLELGGRVLGGLLGCYRALFRDLATMPQNCALQLLFNLHFLARVLPAPKDSEVQGFAVERLSMHSL